jgi:Dyp-type peroxidase family
MTKINPFPFEDLQGLFRFGHGKLSEASYLLLQIQDVAAAKRWLSRARVTSAEKTDALPEHALQIAFSYAGLRAMGMSEATLEDFSDEFIVGMAGDSSRSRRLGDVGSNAPEYWSWGHASAPQPHLLLMLYAKPNGLAEWRGQIEDADFRTAFLLLQELPTFDQSGKEPFGFADGISQPDIDWAREQSVDPHDRDSYSNLLAIGEVVLGYPNEYGQYTVRPLLDPASDPLAAAHLPAAEDQPHRKDFARNGSYLVLRQLGQDVSGFWQYVDQAAASDPAQREQLAAAMVGRQRDGSPLEAATAKRIPGIEHADRGNHFNYVDDPWGYACPIGAHIRRANPRTGDMPSTSKCWFARFAKMLGFGTTRPDEDLIASTRFHRLLRRGRSYGLPLAAEDAVKPNATQAERGLHFICLVANINRQFEFVQNAWITSSKFAGLQHQRDPLLAHRQPLLSDTANDQFHRPDPAGPPQKYVGLPQFISVRGGAYFFMPGLRALRYLAALP